jgi:hypothetical protein
VLFVGCWVLGVVLFFVVFRCCLLFVVSLSSLSSLFSLSSLSSLSSISATTRYSLHSIFTFSLLSLHFPYSHHTSHCHSQFSSLSSLSSYLLLPFFLPSSHLSGWCLAKCGDGHCGNQRHRDGVGGPLQCCGWHAGHVHVSQCPHNITQGGWAVSGQ